MLYFFPLTILSWRLWEDTGASAQDISPRHSRELGKPQNLNCFLLAISPEDRRLNLSQLDIFIFKISKYVQLSGPFWGLEIEQSIQHISNQPFTNATSCASIKT